MKNFIAALAFVFISQFVMSQNNNETIKTCLTIKYFNAEFLYLRSDIGKEVELKFKNFQEIANNKLLKKQKEIEAWENGWKAKGQLLSAEQEQYTEEARKMQEMAMEFETKLGIDLEKKQQYYISVYTELLTKITKEYAIKNSIDVVNSYKINGEIWYYKPNLDITNDLLNDLNKAYNADNFKW